MWAPDGTRIAYLASDRDLRAFGDGLYHLGVRGRVPRSTAADANEKPQLKLRECIDAKFDEQMIRHGLRRARYGGLPMVSMQVLLNVITVNIKRAAKLLRARAASAQPTAVALAS